MKKCITYLSSIMLIVSIIVPLSWSEEDTRLLRNTKNWAYQLENISPGMIARSGFDLVVIDYSADGSEEHAFTASQVKAMQKKTDGKKRILIAYLNIGEIEDYRYYWQASWRLKNPLWMEKENPDWEGNYKVRYWEPEWQKIIFGTPESYLDKIIAAGFNGVLLDVIDAFEYFEGEKKDAREKMIKFVIALSKYAKSKNRNFLIVPQNGEQLLKDTAYLSAVDAIVKEDLFYGMEKEDVLNDPEEIRFSQLYLDLMSAADKPVFIVDYVRDENKIKDVHIKSLQRGYISYTTVRDLNKLVVDQNSK